jgi:hypothetical protein
MKGEHRQGIEDLCTRVHDQIERDLKQHWDGLKPGNYGGFDSYGGFRE